MIMVLNTQDFFKPGFLGNKLLSYIVFIVPSALVLAYVLWSAQLLFSFLKNKREIEVFQRQQSTIRWIKAFLGIEIFLVSGHLLVMIKIFAFGDLRGFASLNSLQYILGTGPIAILLLTFFSPGILYGLPRVPGKKGEINIQGKASVPGILIEKTLRNSWNRGICNPLAGKRMPVWKNFSLTPITVSTFPNYLYSSISRCITSLITSGKRKNNPSPITGMNGG